MSEGLWWEPETDMTVATNRGSGDQSRIGSGRSHALYRSTAAHLRAYQTFQ